MVVVLIAFVAIAEWQRAAAEHRLESWTEATAEVTGVRTRAIDPSRRADREHETTLTYRYTVAGTTFAGSHRWRHSIADGWWRSTPTGRVQGDTVQIRYDPAHPAHSELPIAPRRPWPLVVLAAGVAAVRLVWRPAERRARR